MTRSYAVLGAFVFICFYLALGTWGLGNVNEALYAEIPREMLLSHNFIIPHLNFVPYLEKPPMLYWLIAVCYKLFGLSEFSARFVPATAATSVIISVVRFAKRQGIEREGWLAGLILSTSVIFILLSRVLIFDMLLTAFFTAALLNFYLWYDTDQKKYLRFAYAFVAFAILTKGLFALVITPAIAIVFMLINRTEAKKFWRFFDPLGIALFLLISVPWHVIATLQLPDFSFQYFINEHWYRFLGKRIPHDYHVKSWYFYGPMLIAYFLPWSLFLTSLFRKIDKHHALIKFCWVWFAIPFIFFSLSSAKGDYFVVMCVVPLALILGLKLRTNTLKPLFFATLFIIMSTLLVLSYTSLEPPVAHLAKIVVAVLFAYGVLAAFRLKKSFVWVAGLMIPLTAFLILDKQYFEPKHSGKSIAQVIQKVDPTLPIFFYRNYEDVLASITFYTQKRVTMIQSHSRDLFYGSGTKAADGWFVTKIPQTPSWVVMKATYKDRFKHSGYCAIYQSAHTLLMTNQRKYCRMDLTHIGEVK